MERNASAINEKPLNVKNDEISRRQFSGSVTPIIDLRGKMRLLQLWIRERKRGYFNYRFARRRKQISAFDFLTRTRTHLDTVWFN